VTLPMPTHPTASRRRFLGASMASALAAACTQRDSRRASDGRLVLDVLFETPAANGLLHEHIARRLAAVRPDVVVRLWHASNYSEMLQRNLRDVITDTLPDLAFHGHNSIPLLADRHLAVDLTPYLRGRSESAIPSAEAQVIQDIGRVGDGIYGVPFTVSVPVVYYNEELLRAASGQSDLPSDWAAILDSAQKVRAPSGGVYFPYDSDGSWSFMALLQSFGTDVLTPDARDVAFLNSQGEAAISVVSGIGRARGGTDLTHSQARQSFAAGALGILVDTSNRLRVNTEQARSHFTLRVAPFPMPAGDRARIPPSGASAVVMTRNPDRVAAALDYIRIATSPPIQAAMIRETGFLPPVSDIARRGLITEENELAAAARLPALTRWTAFPGMNSVRINREITNILQQLVSLKVNSHAGLLAIAQTIRGLLKSR
jgi:multiple sugar transport system substrate-binding protein